MKIIRGLLSYLLSYLGDWLSVPMYKWDLGLLYPPYSWLMARSSILQGESEFGPWQKIKKDGQ